MSRGAPLLVSVSPYVPQRSSPYAGHQWYFHYLRALSEHYDVVTLAPGTRQNREAVAAGAPVETRLLTGLGHWRDSELQRGPVDKLGDELLRGVVRLDDGHLEAGTADLLGRAAVVDVQWPRALPHVPELRRRAPGAVVTYLAHDVHWMNWAWDRLGAMAPGPRLAGWVVGRAVRVREARLIRHCDAWFTFKDADVDAVRDAGVVTPGARLDPWLDRPGPGGAEVRSTTDVLYVAAFDRAQNRWGADWLLDRVWPAVLDQVPDARLILVGGGAPDDLRAAVDRSRQVELTGFVDDLGPLYRRAACVVAPVLGGAGLRFKVPQAMLHGRALVVTPLALEGLEGAPAECFVAVTDRPETFAAGVVDALRRTPATVRAEQLGPPWVESQLSFDRSIDVVLATHERGRHVA